MGFLVVLLVVVGGMGFLLLLLLKVGCREMGCSAWLVVRWLSSSSGLLWKQGKTKFLTRAMVREKKKKTNVIRIYSNRVNKHSYCSKCVYLHMYTPTDVVSFETKLCKFHNFFYFINTDMNALKVNKNKVIYTILHATQKKNYVI